MKALIFLPVNDLGVFCSVVFMTVFMNLKKRQLLVMVGKKQSHFCVPCRRKDPGDHVTDCPADPLTSVANFLESESVFQRLLLYNKTSAVWPSECLPKTGRLWVQSPTIGFVVPVVRCAL